jgi:hypothetical protein
MSRIETLIKEAAREGRFRQLTLFLTPESRWQASTRRPGNLSGWRVEIRDTALEALEAVLSDPLPSTPANDEGDIFG